MPRKLLNLLPFKWGTYSRFGHFMLPTVRVRVGVRVRARARARVRF